MLLDGETQFSNRQALTATAVSTNYIDLQDTGTRQLSGTKLTRDIGGWGRDLLVQVTQDFVGGTSVQVQVQVDDNPAFTTPRVTGQTAAVPVADLKAGYRFSLHDFPIGTNERYVRLNYVVVGTPTAGNVTAAATMGTTRHVV